MTGASVTKTAELLGSSRAAISRTMTESGSTEKPPATTVILAGLPNIPDHFGRSCSSNGPSIYSRW